MQAFSTCRKGSWLGSRDLRTPESSSSKEASFSLRISKRQGVRQRISTSWETGSERSKGAGQDLCGLGDPEYGDGLSFDVDSIRSERITEVAEYHGVRLHMTKFVPFEIRSKLTSALVTRWKAARGARLYENSSMGPPL